jgi:ketosteroid isomerase-like protein
MTDEVRAILIAKSNHRDAFNNGDVEGVLSVFADRFTDFSDGGPSFFGEEGRRSLRLRTEQIFRDYKVVFAPVIIDVVVRGDTAYDYGWQKMWSEPRSGGTPTFRKERYFETWRKGQDGQWKLTLIMTNMELPAALLPA